MRTCSRCGATYGETDRFCEIDGQSLARAGEAPESDLDATDENDALGEASTMKMAAIASCHSCGEPYAPGEGDGYCNSCGARLDPAPPGAGPRGQMTAVASGSKIGAFEVLAAFGDEIRARSANGEEVSLVLGSSFGLELEADGLRLAGKNFGTPGLRGEDSRRGSFLQLSEPPAKALRLDAIAGKVGLRAAMALLRETLRVAELVDKARFSWQPTFTDLFVTETGELWVRRLRGARRLSAGENLDVAPLFQAVGAALLPQPLVRAPTSLLHLILAHSPSIVDPVIFLPQARRVLDETETELLHSVNRARVGVACDQGLRRDHNEDATAHAVEEGEPTAKANSGRVPWAALVVCDGVSASTHADQASLIGSKTTRDALAHFVRSGDVAFEAPAGAMAAAIRSAHIAICTFAEQSGADEPPGTTIVSALVHGGRMTVGWVGDSRAYWIAADGPDAKLDAAADVKRDELLTHDHSWVNEAVARGEMTEAEAMQQPLAHALTRCLGPLESRGGPIMVTPDVKTRELHGKGHLILCSDGMWNYFPEAREMGALVRESIAAGENTPSTIARTLLNHALAQGGQDNVSVMVFYNDEWPFEPSGASTG